MPQEDQTGSSEQQGSAVGRPSRTPEHPPQPKSSPEAAQETRHASGVICERQRTRASWQQNSVRPQQLADIVQL